MFGLGGRLRIDFLSLHPADLDARTKSQRQVARGDLPVLSSHFVKSVLDLVLDAKVRDRHLDDVEVRREAALST
jgi:hypothetical protein